MEKKKQKVEEEKTVADAEKTADKDSIEEGAEKKIVPMKTRITTHRKHLCKQTQVIRPSRRQERPMMNMKVRVCFPGVKKKMGLIATAKTGLLKCTENWGVESRC